MRKRITVLIIIAIILCVFLRYENHHLVVAKYTYESEKVPEALNGYRIVQISDLHNAKFGSDNKKLLSKISDLNPNIIVITGDIVDSNHTNIERSLEFVEKACEICDVYYVTGNHEYWLSEKEQNELYDGITRAGARILKDEAVDITYNGASFCLIGIDDKSLYGDALKNIMKTLEKDTLTVALAHEPQFLSDYAATGVDVVFTGHAHGGQVILPFVGGLVAPDQGFLPKLTSGVHKSNNTTMYISRGLGNSVIPFRVFNDPEIVCVELENSMIHVVN